MILHRIITILLFSFLWCLPISAATLAIQTTGVDDSYMNQGDPTNNHGTSTTLTGKASGVNQRNIILSFDFSSLDDSATISDATLYLEYYGIEGSDAVGESFEINRCTQTGWVEAQVTWDDYATSTAWTSGGGDFTATDNATQTVPASYGTMTWDITTIVQWAQSNSSEVIHLIGEFASGATSGVGCDWRSTDYATAGDRPELIITYTVGGEIVQGVITF